jgi:hypothetical protein
MTCALASPAQTERFDGQRRILCRLFLALQDELIRLSAMICSTGVHNGHPPQRKTFLCSPHAGMDSRIRQNCNFLEFVCKAGFFPVLYLIMLLVFQDYTPTSRRMSIEESVCVLIMVLSRNFLAATEENSEKTTVTTAGVSAEIRLGYKFRAFSLYQPRSKAGLCLLPVVLYGCETWSLDIKGV